MNNIQRAFPEKSLFEQKKIAKKFYKNLIDTFIETIKMLSISDKQFHKMIDIDLEEAVVLAKKGVSIQFVAGHQFNWELANWLIAEKMPIPFVGVYMKINNKSINRLFYNMRSKMGTVLVSAQEFKNKMHHVLSKQYSIGLASDQNPGVPGNAYWMNFFKHPAPFITGPHKAAIKSNMAVIYVSIKKIKRGKYQLLPYTITENAASFTPEQLAIRFRDLLEVTIKEHPDNYLWSHRRWKWNYQNDHHKNWIDITPAPSVNS